MCCAAARGCPEAGRGEDRGSHEGQAGGRTSPQQCTDGPAGLLSHPSSALSTMYALTFLLYTFSYILSVGVVRL